jgi:hypothetical protein
MTKDEFCALPFAICLALLYDANPSLSHMAVPSFARPPRYDNRLYRKGGFVWMSEMLLNDLQWWRNKKQESVDSGGEYAEKDAKSIKALDAFIAWRTIAPTEAWSGTRGEDRVTAAPPSKSPVVNESGPKRQQQQGRADSRTASSGGGSGYSDSDYGASAEDDLPFIRNAGCSPEEWNKP